MVSERDVSAAIGSTAYGSDGESVGTVETFYTDDRTGATTWVSVSSGLLGRKQVIAPAWDATFVDGRLQLSVPADAVSSAPRMGGEHLSPEDEEALRRHYARGVTSRGDDAERLSSVDGAADEPAPSQDVAGPGDGTMVRSEEQLRVATERVVDRRMRVVKYVVTEEVQVTVPVRREEIRIEEVPGGGPDDGGLVTEGDALHDGPAAGSVPGQLPEEIVLHAERPVVTVEVVPVERVRLRTEVVAGQTSVTETVEREQVTVDHVPAHPER
ncbi:PRC-barrel domain-containing protein [Blastococcus goldschmidtiae]|uniref:PRC-barrel domain-containing protein n=1 Tax=Blastococcus goldschmidtiae TaxID=3075546 RepID=A0ABU2K1Y4_9ACTN|nr:PRC-barrel domain-containing protein [Blastococcus sp. DSM 46792]MDT0274358.1 PRC-barrel domain-containing protein [Blastococcus sp. DSM 46792]